MTGKVSRRGCRRALLTLAIALPLAPIPSVSGQASGSEPPTLRQAELLLRQGRAAAATVLLEDLVEHSPASSEALALLGTARYLDRRYAAAEEPLRRAVDAGRRDAGTLYYLASTLWENGDLAAAEEICDLALELHGPRVPLLHLRSRLAIWLGDFESAVPWLRQAVAASPMAVDLWLDLAGALKASGDIAEALAAYQHTVELAPDHYQARYGLARALAQSGRAEESQQELERYRALLAEDQRHTLEEGVERARLDRGDELVRQGRAEEALRHLEQMPQTVDVLAATARAYRVLGERQAAIRALEQAVALEPGREDLRAELAAIRLTEGEKP